MLRFPPPAPLVRPRRGSVLCAVVPAPPGNAPKYRWAPNRTLCEAIVSSLDALSV